VDTTTIEKLTMKPDVGNSTMVPHVWDQAETSITPLKQVLVEGLPTLLTRHETMILCAPVEGTEG